MKVTRESVLDWLKKEHRSREWLATECDVGTGAVSNWLREKNPRAIPAKAVVIIQGLMSRDQAARIARERTPQNLVLEFSDLEFTQLERASMADRKTVREWSKETLNNAAKENIEEVARRLTLLNDEEATYGRGKVITRKS
jgi:hypothetical protein